MRISPSRVPLERAPCRLGLASRTQARALIQAGRIAADGRKQTDPLLPVVPEQVRLSLDGRSLVPPGARPVALHNRRGVLTASSDPRGRPTVFQLLSGMARHLGAVGGLDRASSGLLLLTSDTRLASWLTHPRNAVPLGMLSRCAAQ